MPGPVSDSYDPEFGTSSNVQDIRDEIEAVKTKISATLGEELKHIVSVVHGKAGKLHAIPFSEKERRVIRFCLNRAMESL